jgi:hypothetical protein
MPTISGFIRRNFTLTDPTLARYFVWFCFLAGVILFSVWWHKSADTTPKHIGLLAISAVLLAPYAHYHELTLLLVPIFCLLQLLEKQPRVDSYYLAVLPLVVSWLSALGYVGAGILKFPIMYTIMFLFGYALLNSEKVASLLRDRNEGNM